MTEPLTPADEGELAEIVGKAYAARTPLSITGGGTQSGYGRPTQTAATLTTSALSGITLYEPQELVVSARAGTPIANVAAMLAGERQRLAFDPPDRRGLYGVPGTPTIGAVAATNASGPRRIQGGAARDSLLGVRAVNGQGEIVRSGGRVMKNVTGYDLVKFLAGSFGTLAVLSEVTFKVAPIPETEATLVLSGLDDARAVAALSAALGSPWSVTGAAHIPSPDARTIVRIEGFGESVKERATRLTALLAPFGPVDVPSGEESAAMWRSVGDLSALNLKPDAAVWRISVRPSDGPVIVEAIRRNHPLKILYDWGGGLVWIAIDGAIPDAGAPVVRAAVRAVGGHATLMRASDHVRLSVDVFQPLAPPLLELTRKLKAAFDPAGVLNPGRMVAGI
jgi:glycolate oxidase FAD binding subunit